MAGADERIYLENATHAASLRIVGHDGVRGFGGSR